MKASKGISIIVCCYNSSDKLKQTLEHLSKQDLDNELKAEIILVNNNSKDNTVNCAKEIWELYKKPYPLRIFEEKQSGLTYARKKGVESAKYSYLIFCDDDNWLCKTYSKTVFSYFEKNDEIAIIGGMGEAVFEQYKPFWFQDFYYGYAVGRQGNNEKFLNAVYGAGMAVRLEVLKSNQFNSSPFLLNDRTGSKLFAGGDSEICLRARLLGYKILYSEKLTFKHFLNQDRLNWKYLIKLYAGFSYSHIPLHMYGLALNETSITNFYWLKQSLLNFARVIKYSLLYMPKLIGDTEGKPEIIQLKGWLILGFDFLRYNFRLNRILKNLNTIKNSD
jgi:glycosyltransferase involved in cell wall biosynthesis